jgi:HK97 family phage prohead protease
MEYKAGFAFVKEVNNREVIGFTAIMGNIDAGGDRLFRGAFKKTIQEQAGRIRHLWQHNYMMPPTAVVKDLQEVPAGKLPSEVTDKHPDATGGLQITREYLDTPRADEILKGITSGAINEMSFGYDPVKFDFEEVQSKEAPFGLVRNLREVRLWDTSDVNWGMNPATVASKVAVPYHDYGQADVGTAWSKPSLGDFTSETDFGALSTAEKRRIMNHYAWAANNPPESFGDLKFPHHKAAQSGVGAAVWNGVRAAMSVLMGGMGGANIPDGDRRSVYNHLANHYKEFDKEPPEFKLVELSNLSFVLMAPDTLKEGRVLSKRNLARLKEALATLQDILAAAEPPDEGDSEKVAALTEQVLRKLAIAERDPVYFLMR